MPYALIAAALAAWVGIIPAGYGLNPFAALTAGLVILSLLPFLTRGGGRAE